MAVCANGEFHRQLVDIGFEIFLLLPTIAVQQLAEVTLAVEQANTNQRDTEIGSAFDVVSRENAESAGIDRDGFMQTKFSREVRNRTRSQNTRMLSAPGSIRFEVFALTPVGVIDAAVEHELLRSALNAVQRNFAEHRNWVVIELFESQRIEVTKQTGRIVIPAPP